MPVMKVKKIHEAGYDAAMYGLSMSYGTDMARARETALRLAPKDGGHNKFLEAIYLWLDVRAPRYVWQEMDTYRISSKQSESTMHTLANELKRIAEIHGEERRGEAMSQWIKESFEPECYISQTLFLDLTVHACDGDLISLKANLLEGFLQSRLWVMSYKTLRNIILQRRTHRLPHWHMFIEQVLEQVNHVKLLPKGVSE